MSELKKCPFCGNTNICVMMDWEIEGRDESDGAGFYSVVCNYLNGGCGACGGYRETKDEAIIAWNKRESEVEESEVRNRN